MGLEQQTRLEYRGPKDVGRAESLYRSALTKPDPEYCLQLLFAALAANPEHAGAFGAILGKSAELLAAKRKVSTRAGESAAGTPAEEFIRALAAYAATGSVEAAILCAGEARKVDLMGHAAVLGERVLAAWEEARTAVKAGAALKLAEVLEAGGTFELAVRVVQCAERAFPGDDALKEREKNLLARQYLVEHDPGTGDFRTMLQNRPQQEAAQRPLDPATRVDELEQQYRQTNRLEDFRELVRALREVPAARREEAIPVLQEGYGRFGEKEILWMIREIKLQRRWSEARRAQKALEATPDDAGLQSEYERLRQDILREQIDHLYEVVSSLPPGPDRHKRELELARRLLEANRHEEAIKQAQRLKGRAEFRTDAWIIMAKAFVQMGLDMEAAACFENILSALQSEAQGTPERVLDAKYSYAEFLVAQAEEKKDRGLAAQARRLCADVILEDIDYRGIRELSAKAETLVREGPSQAR
jgi:hypothetical protein